MCSSGQRSSWSRLPPHQQTALVFFQPQQLSTRSSDHAHPYLSESAHHSPAFAWIWQWNLPARSRRCFQCAACRKCKQWPWWCNTVSSWCFSHFLPQKRSVFSQWCYLYSPNLQRAGKCSTDIIYDTTRNERLQEKREKSNCLYWKIMLYCDYRLLCRFVSGKSSTVKNLEKEKGWIVVWIQKIEKGLESRSTESWWCVCGCRL